MQSKDFIERVKREVSLESYISRYVRLKRQGKRLWGLCPFHGEKTPSFSVSSEINIYHCFGCGKSGDLFRFVMDYERVEFPKAMQILSEFSGIPISQDTENWNDAQKEKKELYTLNDKVANYFIKNLFSPEGLVALEYLKNRGLSEREIKHFSLGYALPGFQNLTVHLKGPEIDRAKKLGLLKEGKERTSYDFFRDRVIFPIKDTSGRVVGFGGRLINDSNEAKYVNSPASSIYDKGSMFYNLDYAQNIIRQSRVAVIVEGYLDVIGLYSRGFENVVAPLGTAITENQIKALKNYADRIVILLDGDVAGKKAALKTSELCFKESVQADVLLLENGMDPFDLSRGKTKQEIFEFFQKSVPVSRFILDEIMGKTDTSSPPETKRKALENLFQFTRTLLLETDQESFLLEGSKRLGLGAQTVLNDFKKGMKVSFNTTKDDNQSIKLALLKKKEVLSPLMKCERKIISMLIQDSELLGYLGELSNVEFSDQISQYIWEYIYSRLANGEMTRTEEIFSTEFPEEYSGEIAEYLLEEKMEDPDERNQIFEDLNKQWKRLKIDQEISELESPVSWYKGDQMERLKRLHELKLKKQELIQTRQ